MSNNQVRFVIEFTADMDYVPGMFHVPDDWAAFVHDRLQDGVGHYHAQAKIINSKIMFADGDEQEFSYLNDKDHSK
jgi:hypothetical protein